MNFADSSKDLRTDEAALLDVGLLYSLAGLN